MALQSLRQQMDVWFCRVQEPMPRGTLCVLNILEMTTCTLSRACPEHPCLYLTNDYMDVGNPHLTRFELPKNILCLATNLVISV